MSELKSLNDESIFPNKPGTKAVVRVSVIIPTYRRPEFLCRAIESVLNQTFQEFELIVVDDCSGGLTHQVMKNYTDPRICFLQHKTRKGGAATRNTGIRIAQGQYIAFLDDDDEWVPEKLTLQVDLLDNSPSRVGMVYAGYNQVARETGELLAYKAATKTGNLSIALRDKNWVGTTSSVLLRKECIETVGLFDENLSSLQDYDLWIRIAREFEFSGINKPLVTYHVHNERISTNIEALTQGLELMLKKHRRSNFGYSIYLEIGTRCCLQNDIRKSREAYLRAITLYPLGLKAYMGFGLSLFGLRSFKIFWKILQFWHPVDPTTLKLSLRQNFSWTIVGNAVNSGFKWGIVLLLANIGSPAMVGQYALGLAVVEPVFLFGNLNLRVVLATDSKREYAFTDYLNLRLLTVVFSFLTVFGIALVVGYRWETFFIIILLGLVRTVDSISDLFYGLFQQHEQMDLTAKSMLMKAPLLMSVLGMGVYFSGNLWGGVVGLIGVGLLILLGYDLRRGMLVLKPSAQQGWSFLRKKANAQSLLLGHFNMRNIIKLSWFALPLGFVMMLVALNISIPRLFIDSYFGEEELGIFAAVASIMSVGTLVVTALGQTATPRLANYYATGNMKNFCYLMGKLIVIGTLLGVTGLMIALVGGREILAFLYQPEYADHADVLVWIMAAAGVSYLGSFLGHGMTAAKYFKPQVPLFACVACITALASFILIPSAGLLGAAISVLIGVSFQTGSSLLVLFYAIWKSRTSGHQGVQLENGLPNFQPAKR